MKLTINFIFLVCVALSFGQEKKNVPTEIIEAIKNDVWMPFMESYAELDSDKLKSIHSKDIVRVTIDQNEIRTGQPYIDYFSGFLDIVKERGSQVSIAFAILSTAVDESGDLGYQTGYYCYSSKRKDDEKMIPRGYGYFNVGLKKVNGTWKIWLDSDKNAEITHEDFKNHETVYELSRSS
ncbi:MAG: hypothetical protein AB3N18_16205 [Allomuricauda sp.]